jgi:predicted acylesterase/phospholipase RssA
MTSEILILPVSGGGFVSQIALLLELSKINYKPDLTLASSGGNVAAYLAAAADWNCYAMYRLAQKLNHKLFLNSWHEITSFNILIGFFQSNIFNQGKGVEKLLNSYFDGDSILKYEIWTGTYNTTRQKPRLFCNLSKDQSQINYSKINSEITNAMEPIYCAGDLKLISTASLASASIPSIVPAQRIHNEEYVDGGICGSSPLMILKDALPKFCHLTYVNSIDLAQPRPNVNFNVFDVWRNTAHDLIKSSTLIDRDTAYSLFKNNLPPNAIIHRWEGKCTRDNLLFLQMQKKRSISSFLELYPHGGDEFKRNVNLSNFNEKDVINAITKIRDECSCLFYYSTISTEIPLLQ